MKLRMHPTAGQRGYSLIEITVAMAIFIVVIVAALMVYDSSNKTFKSSVESSEMQQSTRVAFDKMVGEIRLAGFDFDRDGIPMSSLAVTWAPNTNYTVGNLVQPNPPNGHTYTCTAGGTSAGAPPSWPEIANATVAEGGGSTVKWRESGAVQYQQPDEQIEYAATRAITLRSNYDYETDAATDNGREQDPQHESAAFPVVTTGNDEIVTYALRSTNATANKDKIVFYADTAIPRNVHPGTKKKEKEITISGVDLSGQNPPYTLVRFTLDENGNPDAGTAIADNIRDLRFTYYSDTLATTKIEDKDIPLGAGQYDASKPDDVIAERDKRAEIQAIQLSLIGMNPQPDYSYTDSDTVAAARNFRKLQLESVVIPRNLGRRGMREFNVEQPGSPVLKSICTGGCNAVYLAWEPPAGKSGDIDSYSVLYDDDGCTGGFAYSEDAAQNLDHYVGRFLEPGKVWYFAVQAINKFGATTSNCVSAMVKNTTKPAPLASLKATGGDDAATLPALVNKINLYFPTATANEAAFSTAACDTGGVNSQSNMPPPEKRYYRIVRGTTANFQPTDTGVKTILTEYSTTQPVIDGTGLRFTDAPPNPTASCTDYYYRVQVVDYCARSKPMNDDDDDTLGISTFYPALGDNAVRGSSSSAVKPDKTTLVLAGSTCNGGQCDVDLSWTPVSKQSGVTNGPVIYVRDYILKVYRKNGLTWSTTPDDIITVKDATTYKLEKLIQAAEYRFTVTAKDCLEGDPSEYLYFPCDFGTTTVSVNAPVTFGGNGSAASPWIIQPPASFVVTASSPVSKIEASVFEGNTQVGSMSTPALWTGTSYTFDLPELTTGTAALIRVTITDLAGKCTIYADRYVIDEPPPSCVLRDVNSDASVMKFTNGSNTIALTLKNTSATETLTLKRITINWDVAKGETLDSITVPGAGTLSTNCKLATTSAVIPSSATKVAPGATSYGIAINYVLNGNKKLPDNPINSVCVEYQSSTGDTKQCSIAPNAGACTSATGTCQ